MINTCKDRNSNISIDDNAFWTEINLNAEVPGTILCIPGTSESKLISVQNTLSSIDIFELRSLQVFIILNEQQ